MQDSVSKVGGAEGVCRCCDIDGRMLPSIQVRRKKLRTACGAQDHWNLPEFGHRSLFELNFVLCSGTVSAVYAGMDLRMNRLTTTVLTTLIAVLFALPALALDFTVHGYELGERIQLTSGRNVWTAEFQVSLEGVAGDTTSFCVDLDTHIGVGSYDVQNVLDAYREPSPKGEAERNFSWAGYVMDRYGSNIDALVDEGTTRRQAITGVQAAIWERIYDGNIVAADSLSIGARNIYDQILENPFIVDGPALIVDLAGNQDQVISAAVPEPSAALIFGIGAVIAGSASKRR